MKKILFCFMSFVSLSQLGYAQGNALVLAANISKEDRWAAYDESRSQDRSVWEQCKLFWHEFCEGLKYSMPLDILFFKNNKIETEFAQEILAKYDLTLDDVSILHKDLRAFPFSPGFTVFNTIILDQHEMAKHTKEEQAFLLAHEIAHLKKRHWVYKFICALTLAALGRNANGTFTMRSNQSPLSILYATFVGVPLYCYMSRQFELEADRDAAAALDSAQAGISTFEKMLYKKISRADFAYGPHGFSRKLLSFFSMLYGQHPTLEERIEALQQYAESTANKTD